MLSGENGILKNASKSKEKTEYAGIYEAIIIELQNYKINKTLEDVETCKDYFSQVLNLETTGNNNDFYCIYKNYLVRIDGEEQKILSIDKYPINNKIDLKQVGAYGNGVNDETEILNYAFSNFDNIYIPKGKYIVNNKVKVIKKFM